MIIRVICRGMLWGIASSVSTAVLSTARADWFGAGDLRPFFVYSLPLVLLTTIVGVALWRTLVSFQLWSAYLVGGFVGGVLGLLWTIGSLFMFGPWFGAWSIPVLLCWTASGALGVAAAAATRAGWSLKRHATEGIIFVVITTVLSIGYPSLTSSLTNDQHLTFIYGRWEARDSELLILDPLVLLSDEDRELLYRSGIRGSVELMGSHGSNTTDRPKARMLVLLSRPVEKSQLLQQPDRTNVIYVQDRKGFHRFPTDASVLDRFVEIYQDPARPEVSAFWVDGARGGRSGSDAIRW